MKNLDYISILTGGSCKFGCTFCVGNDIRKNVTPHISRKYKSFIDCFGDLTKSISVSGSTSDPSLLDLSIHREIISTSKAPENNLVTNLHTREIKSSFKMIELCKMYDGIVFSIDENFLEEDNLIDFSICKKVRFSIVITKETVDFFDREWLDKVYKKTGVASFTFRPDVFDDVCTIDEFSERMNFDTYVQGKYAQWFSYNDKFVTYWDNKEFSQDVRYLWSDGNITKDCEWKKLY